MMNQDVTEGLKQSYTRLITKTDVVILPSVNFSTKQKVTRIFFSMKHLHNLNTAMQQQFILWSHFIASTIHSWFNKIYHLISFASGSVSTCTLASVTFSTTATLQSSRCSDITICRSVPHRKWSVCLNGLFVPVKMSCGRRKNVMEKTEEKTWKGECMKKKERNKTKIIKIKKETETLQNFTQTQCSTKTCICVILFSSGFPGTLQAMAVVSSLCRYPHARVTYCDRPGKVELWKLLHVKTRGNHKWEGEPSIRYWDLASARLILYSCPYCWQSIGI